MTPNPVNDVKTIVLGFKGSDDSLDITLDSTGFGDNLELITVYLDRTIETLFDSSYFDPDTNPVSDVSDERQIKLTFSGPPQSVDIDLVSHGLGGSLELIAKYLHKTIHAILESEEAGIPA